MEEETKKKCCKFKFGLWQIISVVLLVVLIVSIFTNGFGVKALFGKSAGKLGEEAISFINKNLMGNGMSASLVGSGCQETIQACKFTINVKSGAEEGKDYDSFISRDGKYLFPDVFDIEEVNKSAKASSNNQVAEVPKEIPKTDKPSVKLFVMTYCPYGLQAQKAMLPVMDLFKDKADIQINFVSYAMHEKKEIDENLRQYCIQKEQKEKYATYFECFVKAGEYENCLTESKVDQKKMNKCIAATDEQFKITAQYEDKTTWLNGNYPLFDVEKDLNVKYGVQGSPTMVINDVVVSPARTPQGYKEEICQAFNTLPEECAQTLSENTPVAGLGVGESAGTAAGACE